ncbi:hypothetical protein B9Z55_004557 [Caenorhabditis nigoni]|uniref:Domain of unknown function WSN domain-containing protein n=1 Tax=Caenorhabditis nigoni TaxID=1611254 RepID=A0A2G5UX42_9PELO|nr:hypothetical protein B9Z55_004557 [Caenorhabditis nigoni]
MRKILTFFSLLLTVTANASAKNNPTNALHVIIEKFESLSRITNGLALQKELNSKSLKIDHLLAEILGINPENNGFEELRMFKMDDLSKRYAELSKDAGGVKKSEIDEAMVKSQLEVLGKMGEDLEVLKSGESQNVDEIVKKGEKIFEIRVSSISEAFNTFPRALNKTFNLKDGRSDEKDFKSSFKSLSDIITDFREKVGDLMNYETTFQSLWAINGLFSQLGSIRTLGNAADVYNSSYANLTKLKDNMGTLNKDIPVLIPFIKQSSEIKNLSKDLEKLHGMFGNLSTGNPPTRLLTAGLSRGTQDIERLFQDVNTQWFKKSIANDDENTLKKMISDLNVLKALNGKMTETEVHWRSFKTKTDNVKVEKSLNLVEGASHHVMDINSFQTLQLSSSEVEGCLKDLTQVSVDVDFEQLNKILNQLESIEKAALELKPLLVEFSEISIFENETMFNDFESDLSKIDHTLNYMGLQQEADKLRAKPEYKDLLKGSLKAIEIIGKIENIGIRNLLIRKIQKWDALSKAKSVLNETSLIQTLDCLQQKKFDAAGISKLLTFGSLVRSIGDEYKKDKSMETFIGQLGQFQKSLKNLTTSARSKRSPSNSTVDSLQNGLTVSQDLSKGVDLLRKMGAVYGKKNELDMVMAGGKEVFQEVKKMIASVDSEKLESEMKKTSDDLEKLNSKAKKYPNPSLQVMGEFFENASTIHGVSIDSKLLANPVAASFEKSSNQKLQGVAVPLKTLGSLQLDFSNGKSDFKSAQLSISKLQEYFDQVFSISRNSQNAESEPFDFKTYGMYGGSGLVFIAVLIGLIFVARWIVNDRKRSNPKYYIHLKDSGDLEKAISGENNSFHPIHLAIRERDLKALKKCIMNGANVNSYVLLDEKWMTPLHMAVDKGECRMAKLLIMNGADRTLKDSNYQTPEESIDETDHDMKKTFEELKGKSFRRRVPKQFPKSKWLIFGSFPGRWRSQSVSMMDTATHIELWETKNAKGEEHINIDSLMNDDPAGLKFLFSNVMIVKSSWKKECRKWWRLWIPDDYEHRATRVKINGKIYETVAKIHQHIQEARIPFLDGVRIVLMGFSEEEKASKGVRDALKATASGLTSDKVLITRVPIPTDSIFKQGNDHPAKPYYFDNMGHIFIIVGCEMSEVAKIKGWNPQFLTCNRFSVMTVTEFLVLLFKFEPHHYKLSGKEDKTTFKSWHPFTELPAIQQDLDTLNQT